MTDDRDTQTVIGFKKRPPKVAKAESLVNGTSPLFRPNTAGTDFTDLAFSRKYSTVMPLFFATSHITYMQARRSGASVTTDKKLTAGGNKAHQGTSNLPRIITYLIYS